MRSGHTFNSDPFSSIFLPEYLPELSLDTLPNFLISYLKLYPEYCKGRNQALVTSIGENTKYAVEQLRFAITGEHSTFTKINELINTITNNINSYATQKDPHKWYEFILILRKDYSKQAQLLKTKDGLSTFFEVCNALASFIIVALRNHEKFLFIAV